MIFINIVVTHIHVLSPSKPATQFPVQLPSLPETEYSPHQSHSSTSSFPFRSSPITCLLFTVTVSFPSTIKNPTP
ncbi:hypothetical protein Peur_019491 [Populus x canadensis]